MWGHNWIYFYHSYLLLFPDCSLMFDKKDITILDKFPSFQNFSGKRSLECNEKQLTLCITVLRQSEIWQSISNLINSIWFFASGWCEFYAICHSLLFQLTLTTIPTLITVFVERMVRNLILFVDKAQANRTNQVPRTKKVHSFRYILSKMVMKIIIVTHLALFKLETLSSKSIFILKTNLTLCIFFSWHVSKHRLKFCLHISARFLGYLLIWHIFYSSSFSADLIMLGKLIDVIRDLLTQYPNIPHPPQPHQLLTLPFVVFPSAVSPLNVLTFVPVLQPSEGWGVGGGGEMMEIT